MFSLNFANVLIFLPALLYALVILGFLSGWLLSREYRFSGNPQMKFSVVIPFKNEEKNLPALLDAFLNLKYDLKFVEFVFVNDNSSDGSEQIIKNYASKFPKLKLIRNSGQGKKFALKTGIQGSENEWIITTDADCEPSRLWLKTLAGFIEQNQTADLVLMPVLFKMPGNSSLPEKVFYRFQALEFLSLQASTAGAVFMKMPIMANGANMAFKKSLYLEAGKNMKFETPSGDDIFLLLFAKKKRKKIAYLKSRNAVVYTQPARSLQQLVNQRIRWTSKSKFYSDFAIIFTALIVFVFNTLIVCCALALKTNTFLLLLLIKALVDFPLLLSFAKFFGQQKLLLYFLPLEILYPFYVVLTAISGQFVSVKWK